ncbi:hypothetical protein BCR44DRAFT_60022 [Catenaria anguillulae PL171]|uniref:Uncharacterized protein n=1 Tax=Catenaria anguillulae PL171 TaxID=765915 RepID=A0A1Y2HWG3_9FUNG|nr:hypothetical protein BCR44DRAFT_60022 [Catenaria anguillulae PL171]
MADLAPLQSSPWTTVTSLTLGTPLFSPLNWLDSLHQLAIIAAAFPNVTSLSLKPYFPAIADVLLACDPFLRRPPAVGRPLRRLSIVRSHSEQKLPELKRAVQTDNKMVRTQLNMTRASPHHLEQLVLADTGLYGDHSWWQDHPVLIHPGLLHGLKYANIMGAHVAVAPPRLATPDSDSFPSVLSLRRKEKPILLAHLTLPNLLALALNGDLERPSTAISLTDALPTCPNLESLMIDMDWSVCLNTWREPAAVICKYPRLRNVCLACVTFNEKQLLLLADHLFGHPIRALRPVPTLARLVIANQSHADELTGLWVGGPEVGAVWMSDVKVPGEFKVVSPCPFLRLFKNPAMVQPAPMYGESCLCGRKMMGRAGAWMHPLDGTIVCAKCKHEVGVKLESKKTGVVARRLTHDMSNYPSFLSEGPWPLAVV